jgi:hypothetical protein
VMTMTVNRKTAVHRRLRVAAVAVVVVVAEAVQALQALYRSSRCRT